MKSIRRCKKIIEGESFGWEYRVVSPAFARLGKRHHLRVFVYTNPEDSVFSVEARSGKEAFNIIAQHVQKECV